MPAAYRDQPISDWSWPFILCISLIAASTSPSTWAQAPEASPLPTRPSIPNPTGTSQAIRPVVAFFPIQDADDTAKKKEDEKKAASTPPPKVSLTNLEAVKEQATLIEQDTTLSDELKTRMMATLDEIRQAITTQQSAADELASAEKQLSRLTLATEIAKKEAAETPKVPDNVSDRAMSTESVRRAKAEAETKLAQAKEALQTATADILKRSERLQLLPDEIAKQRQALKNLEASSTGELTDDVNGRLQSLREALRLAQIDATKKRLTALEKEFTLLDSQADLLPLRKTIAEKELAFAEAIFQRWSDALSRRRQTQIQKELAAYRKQLLDQSDDPGDSYVLAKQNEWLDAVSQIDTLEPIIKKEQAQADKWLESLTQIEKQIASANKRGESLSSSEGLQFQLLKSNLPSIDNLQLRINQIEEEIRDNRELQTQMQLQGLATNAGVTDPLAINTFSEGGMPEAGQVRGDLPEEEIRLRAAFIEDLKSLRAKLIDRQITLENTKETVAKLSRQIDAHIVWVRNCGNLAKNDFVSAWQLFRGIMHPQNLLKLSQRIAQGFWRRPELILIALVSCFTIVAGGARLRRRLTELGQRASSKTSTSLRPTFAASLLSFSLMLPLAALLWVAGDALLASGGRESFTIAVARAARVAALAVAPIELLRQWLRKSGLAVAHFDAEEATISGLRGWLRVLIDLGIPILLLSSTAYFLGRHEQSQALHRITMMAGMLLLSVVVWQVLGPRSGLLSRQIRLYPDGWIARLRYVFFLPVVCLPLIFAAVSAAGYVSGSVVLIERLYYTFWLCLIAYYLGGIMRRWVLTQRRRLVWAVHRERVEEAQRLGAGPVEVETPSGLEASEINAQTNRLIQTFLLMSTVIGIAYIWSPVLPALGYLESIHLWATENEQGELVYVTLADLIKTLPVLILTWVSVRNLPGLVEGVLLERLPLEKPVRYAITTLGTYVLMILGVMLASQTLGLRWQNIQWLVAALGVGLGFGLQEIFANFISGLILLFEQPIRVGDVVTLGDTTGVVAKIRMRATTVTNWDRQELIIPNKDLITGRLINWTLSDSTNRLVLHVGIAYGSDTEAACDLLRQICAEHPDITEDPQPVVTFEGFGDSTLNLVLRCYLASLDNRLKTSHELHTEINKRFNQAGLEIAFPQRDLHLRSLPPELMAHLAKSA